MRRPLGSGDYEELPRRARRRLAAWSLLRSLAATLVIFVGYFALPLYKIGPDAAPRLGIWLILIAALLAWQIREIARSPYPRVRVTEALATTVPLFFGAFASTYYAMGQADPATFTQPLTKLDALYFTVSTFATVGFGDIAAVSEPARAVTVVQMLGDLVIVGFVARAVVNAVQVGLNRRGR